MWRQKGLIKKLLDLCNLGSNDKVLDAPCGTGYIGGILSRNKASIVASDISLEMMELAGNEYYSNNFLGFVQSDITKSPFVDEEFRCVIVLALMHRLPEEIRKNVLSEIERVSSKFVIVSYSIESLSQRLKQWVLLKAKKSHVPAPASISLEVIHNELSAAGLKIIKMNHIVYFLSAKVVFLAVKENH
jgi:ubiquinone/menaquinone biosynthesis C-methylase UbiE